MSDLGTCRQVHDGWELRFERRLRHPPEAVWAAITEPDGTAAWWGTLERNDARQGGRFVLAWVNEGGPTMTATITTWVPPRLLELDGDVHGRLRWALAPDGDGTLLTFTSTVGQLPEGEFQGRTIGVPEVLTGWHSHLDALDRSFDGGGWDQALWDAALPRYRS